MEQALKPEAQGNVAVEPVADLIAQLREGIPAYDVTQDGIELHDIDAAEMLMCEAASSIASGEPPLIGLGDPENRETRKRQHEALERGDV